MESIGVRQARAELPTLIEAGEPVTITRHGRPVAALLPPEAIDVWHRHQAEQAAEQAKHAAEEAAGEKVPGKRTPVCPHCKSAMMHVLYRGPIVYALVNTADPSAGVQAVVIDTDPALLEAATDVRCASCWEPMADQPRQHGHRAHQAALDIADTGPWNNAGEWDQHRMYTTTTNEPTRSARIVTAHDLARGHLIRVTYWEWLTGITDAERDQMRAGRASENR